MTEPIEIQDISPTALVLCGKWTMVKLCGEENPIIENIATGEVRPARRKHLMQLLKLTKVIGDIESKQGSVRYATRKGETAWKEKQKHGTWTRHTSQA